MIRGQVVNIAGTDYTVPPFNIAHWELYEEAERANAEQPPSIVRMLKVLGPILVSNIRRNYPDASEAAIMDALDVPTFNDLRVAALTVKHTANPPTAPANPSTGAT